jgi:hypothetical protein
MSALLVPLKFAGEAAILRPGTLTGHASVLCLPWLVRGLGSFAIGTRERLDPTWPRGVLWLALMVETAVAVSALARGAPLWERRLGCGGWGWLRLDGARLWLAELLVLSVWASFAAAAVGLTSTLAFGVAFDASDALACVGWTSAAASFSGVLARSPRTRPAAFVCIGCAPALLGWNWRSCAWSTALASAGLALVALALTRTRSPSEPLSST